MKSEWREERVGESKGKGRKLNVGRGPRVFRGDFSLNYNTRGGNGNWRKENEKESKGNENREMMRKVNEKNVEKTVREGGKENQRSGVDEVIEGNVSWRYCTCYDNYNMKYRSKTILTFPDVAYHLSKEFPPTCKQVCESANLNCTADYHGLTDSNVLRIIKSLLGSSCLKGKVNNTYVDKGPLIFYNTSAKSWQCSRWENIPKELNCGVGRERSNNRRILCPCVPGKELTQCLDKAGVNLHFLISKRTI